jgi:hypothetical protein
VGAAAVSTGGGQVRKVLVRKSLEHFIDGNEGGVGAIP